MIIFLDLGDLLHIAERALGHPPDARDLGLLESAVFRPQTSVLGQDAYPDLETKAAALLHSLANNHALVDGNKRMALAGTLAFLGVNGARLTLTNDEAYDLVTAVASSVLTDVAEIAVRLRAGSAAW